MWMFLYGDLEVIYRGLFIICLFFLFLIIILSYYYVKSQTKLRIIAEGTNISLSGEKGSQKYQDIKLYLEFNLAKCLQ